MNLETREEKRKRREPLLSRVPLLFLLSAAPSCVLTCEATKGVVSVEQKHSLPTSAAAVRRKDEKDSFFLFLVWGRGRFVGCPGRSGRSGRTPEGVAWRFQLRGPSCSQPIGSNVHYGGIKDSCGGIVSGSKRGRDRKERGVC